MPMLYDYFWTLPITVGGQMSCGPAAATEATPKIPRRTKSATTFFTATPPLAFSPLEKILCKELGA